MTVDYYKKLHEENAAYQSNNWLLSEVDFLKEFNFKSILEVGCGNGKFLEAANPYYTEVIGIDWVRSPILKEVGNIKFHQKNLYEDDLEFKTDIVVSADVLEHFKFESIKDILSKLKNVSENQYHVIACYDDGHSHETILEPNEWLKLFREVFGKEVYILYTKQRKGRDICCITNIRI